MSSNSYELLAMVPHLGNSYGYVGVVRKIGKDDQRLWGYSQTGAQFTGVVPDRNGGAFVAVSFGWSNMDRGALLHLNAKGEVISTLPLAGDPVSIAADASLTSLYITGTASSDFKTTTGAYKTSVGQARCLPKGAPDHIPCAEAFVLKISADTQTVQYATLLGGTSGDTPKAIAVGPDGSAYIAGETTSDDFPITPGALKPQYGGTIYFGPLTYGDGFIARLSPDGNRLLYSTYAGSPGPDGLRTVAVSASGGVLAGGYTQDADKMPGATGDSLLLILRSDGTAQQKIFRTPEVNGDIVTDTAASPDGRYFAAVSSVVKEVDPQTLLPLKEAHGRLATITAIAAAEGGVVYTVSGGGANVFAVPSGQPASGSLYVASLLFNEPSQPFLTAVVNAASFRSGKRNSSVQVAIAPGELITIFGEHLGGAGVVSLNGRTIPVSYWSDGQINALVPRNLLLGSAPLLVEAGGIVLGPFAATVLPSVPALFTRFSDTPYGTLMVVAALNQDGTQNSWEHPAKPGSVVALFGTGLGPMDLQSPAILTEHIQAFGPGNSGGGMEILYAGEAPGLPGVQQVNVRVDAEVRTGPQPIAYRTKLVYDLSSIPGYVLDQTQEDLNLYVQ